MTDPAPAKPPVNSLRGLLPFVRPHRGLVAAWLGALAFSSGATLTLLKRDDTTTQRTKTIGTTPGADPVTSIS